MMNGTMFSNLEVTVMKKSVIYAAGLAALALAAAACQEELTGNINDADSSAPAITRTMYVEGNEWTAGDGTRTAYTPGAGVDWTGSETFAVYYGNPANAASPTDKTNYILGKATDVTSLGGGRYSFSHPAIEGMEAYDYCVIVPDLGTTGTNSAGASASFKFSPVQTPGQNTFDPNYDVLFGQGAKEAVLSEELSVTKFKRVFAPLRVSIRDGAGVIGNEKIHAATVSFSQAAVSGGNAFALAGLVYLNFGYEYEDCKINSVSAPTNTVSALYEEGLEKQGDIWPVWYMVKPGSFDAGGSVTVTVATDTRTIRRTIALGSQATIQEGMLNNLDFDITGEGYTVTESVYQDFTAFTSRQPLLTASDGNTYSWSYEKCQAWNGGNSTSPLPYALRLNAGGGNVTLPAIAGKQITAIRLYAHPNNPTTDNTVALNGGTPVDFRSYSDNTETGNSGVLEIEVPEDQYGQPLVLSSGAENFTAFAGIALELTDAEIPDADENDYYDLFTKGHDIEINGEVYNNTMYSARLVNVMDLQGDEIQKDAASQGILFVDPSGQDTAKELSAMTPGTSESVIVIGRYKDKQPQIRFTAQYKLRGAKTVFKNLHLIAGHNISLINSDTGYPGTDIVVEDCTIDATGTRYVIYDASNDGSYGSVTIDNSIVEFNSSATNGPSVVAFSTSVNKTVYGPDMKVSLTNSVIYSQSVIQAFIVNLGDGKVENEKHDGYNSNLNVSGNTFYNIWQPNILVRGNVFTNFTVDRNVASYTASDIVTKASNFACAYKSAAVSSISDNFLYTTAPEKCQWNIVHSSSVVKAGSGNVRNAAESPYLSEDTSTGYFPINTAAVTNGAGADYDTKYWITK